MKQAQILSSIVKEQDRYRIGSHFQLGGKKCRTCNLHYQIGFEKNYCPICGKRLATKSKKKYSRYV